MKTLKIVLLLATAAILSSCETANPEGGAGSFQLSEADRARHAELVALNLAACGVVENRTPQKDLSHNRKKAYQRRKRKVRSIRKPFFNRRSQNQPL